MLGVLAMTFAGFVAGHASQAGGVPTPLAPSIHGLVACVVLLVFHLRGWHRLAAIGATLVALAMWDTIFRWWPSVPAPEVDPARVVSLDVLGPLGVVASLLLLATFARPERVSRVLAGLASLVMLASCVVPQSFAADAVSASGPGAQVAVLGADGAVADARWERIAVTGVPVLLLPDRIENEWRLGGIAQGMAAVAHPGPEALRSAAWGAQRVFAALALVWASGMALAAPLAVAFRWRPYPVLLGLGCALPFLADLVLVIPALVLPEGAPLSLFGWSLFGVEMVALAWAAGRSS